MCRISPHNNRKTRQSTGLAKKLGSAQQELRMTPSEPRFLAKRPPSLGPLTMNVLRTQGGRTWWPFENLFFCAWPAQVWPNPF